MTILINTSKTKIKQLKLNCELQGIKDRSQQRAISVYFTVLKVQKTGSSNFTTTNAIFVNFMVRYHQNTIIYIKKKKVPHRKTLDYVENW